MTDNTITVRVGGQVVTGWQSFKLTRGIETVPSNFECTLVNASNVRLDTGAPCTVYIGSDLALTGYVGEVNISLSAGTHVLTVRGQSKFVDLLTCSAVLEASLHKEDWSIMGNGTVTGTLNSIATQLCKPFNISVVAKEQTDITIPLVQWINVGETPYEIIERLARYARVLVYDDVNGNCVLNDVGLNSMSSGFSYENIYSVNASFNQEEEFSDVYTVWQSFNTDQDFNAANIKGYAQDPNVARFKPLMIVSEQNINGIDIAQARADWEVKRRWGRSQVISLSCNSYRDSNGKLWEPNYLAPINLPATNINGQSWLISQVTYSLSNEGGTTCEVVLMPKEAFNPEPTILQTDNPDFYNGKNTYPTDDGSV